MRNKFSARFVVQSKSTNSRTPKRFHPSNTCVHMKLYAAIQARFQSASADRPVVSIDCNNHRERVRSRRKREQERGRRSERTEERARRESEERERENKSC